MKIETFTCDLCGMSEKTLYGIQVKSGSSPNHYVIRIELPENSAKHICGNCVRTISGITVRPDFKH